MALDVTKHHFAGGAPISTLHMGGSPMAAINGNPFNAGTQEYEEYNQLDSQGFWDASRAIADGMDPQQATEMEIQKTTERVTKQYFQNATDFDKNNPFKFDEALAKSVSNQKFSPYYDQQLSDFLQGITTRSQRSSQDAAQVLQEVNQDTTSYQNKNQAMLDSAMRQSQSGQADAGLFDSGIAKAQTGEMKVGAQTDLNTFLTGENRRTDAANLTDTRTQQDLGTQQNLGVRNIGTQKAADITTDVQSQQKQASQQHEYERLQYLGPAPGQNAADFETQSQNLLYGVGQ